MMRDNLIYLFGAKRDTLEVRMEVIQVIARGIDKPTRIMYAANMSWEPVKRILNALTEAGIIVCTEIIEPGAKRAKYRYTTTSKGAKILDAYRAFISVVEECS